MAVKFLCSFDGKIVPRPTDGDLRYVGGHTRIISVPKDASFSHLMQKMLDAYGGGGGGGGGTGPLVLKYQLPDQDLDALVTVACSEDLDNMMEEYEKLVAASPPQVSPKLRVFLFSSAELGDLGSDAVRSYLDALNGGAYSAQVCDGPAVFDLGIGSGGASEGTSSPAIQSPTVPVSPQDSSRLGYLFEAAPDPSATVRTELQMPPPPLSTIYFPLTYLDSTQEGSNHENHVNNSSQIQYAWCPPAAQYGCVERVPSSIEPYGALPIPGDQNYMVLYPPLPHLPPSSVQSYGYSQIARAENEGDCVCSCRVEDVDQNRLLFATATEDLPRNFQSPHGVFLSQYPQHLATGQYPAKQVVDIGIILAGNGTFQTFEPPFEGAGTEFSNQHDRPTEEIMKKLPVSSFETNGISEQWNMPSRDDEQHIGEKEFFPGNAFSKPGTLPEGTCSFNPVVQPPSSKLEATLQNTEPEESEVLSEEHIQQELQTVAEGVATSVLQSSTSTASANYIHETSEDFEESHNGGGVHNLEYGMIPADKKLMGMDTKQLEKLKPGFHTTKDIGRLQIIKNIDLEELRELGTGTFGTVYHGKWRGSDVAIKRISGRCFAGKPSEQERLRADFWSEACKLAESHHPNVVAFYGVVLDGPGESVATVTEFMVNGSLRSALQRNDKPLDQRRRLLIAMDVACGMEFSHGKNIVHFDLKSDNLLVNLRDPQRPICKVGGLGLSKVKCQTLISGGVRGALPWMAPELLNGSSSRVSDKVDVFSYGIVMWELLTREEPYADLHYGVIIGGIVSNTLRPPIPESCDTGWRMLMEKCWSNEPSERPCFTEVVGELRSMTASLCQKGQA